MQTFLMQLVRTRGIACRRLDQAQFLWKLKCARKYLQCYDYPKPIEGYHVKAIFLLKSIRIPLKMAYWLRIINKYTTKFSAGGKLVDTFGTGTSTSLPPPVQRSLSSSGCRAGASTSSAVVLFSGARTMASKKRLLSLMQSCLGQSGRTTALRASPTNTQRLLPMCSSRR